MSAPARSDPLADRHWRIAPFTRALSGGPATGPLAESGGDVHAVCQAPDGTLFLAHGQRVDAVGRDGRRRHVAGNGRPGLRDGPAPQARFRLGIRAYYDAFNLACAADGSVYLPDSGNSRVRRLFPTAGGWRVETAAGGGKGDLEPGRRAPAESVELKGTLAVAAPGDGSLVIANNWGAYRLRDGMLTHLGDWPASADPRSPLQLHIMMGDADDQGTAYFVSRTPHVVLAVGPDDSITHLAGRHLARNEVPPGDAPAREAYFNTPNSLAAAPGGDRVYVCGGDEYNIRRVPTDGTTPTATLMQDGMWHRLPRHPNRLRGAAVVLGESGDAARPRDKLSLLMVSPLLGRDRSGNLYAGLVHWRGMSQYRLGHGLTPTRLFKLVPEQ